MTSASELGHPDIIFLPGSKNTIRDLKWMRQNGLEAAVKKLSDEVPVFGICGGYQMLGKEISDPEGVEEGGKIRGMELLDVMTELKREKTRCQTEGKINKVEGIFSELSGMDYSGYEIHMGCTTKEGETPLVLIGGDKGNVYGSYVHGIFDRGHIASAIIKALADKKGLTIDKGVFEDYKNFKERQYDHLANTLRAYLNMEDIYGMLNDAHLK